MTAPGEDILAWLDTSITRREQVARDACHRGIGRWTSMADRGFSFAVRDENDEVVVYNEGSPSEAQSDHIAINDPESVLRRCAVDRKLLELHAGRMHSCPAKDETGYLDEWTSFGHEDVCPVVRMLAEGYGWTEGER